MGVVKNLMVRIGANVTGVVQGMKTASNATKEAKESIHKNTTSIKKTVAGSFGGVGNSMRAYTESVKNTRQAHEVARQNVTRLTDQVGNLKSTYITVKSATAGLDLTKPLTTQIVEAEKALTEIEQKRRKIQRELAGITSPKAANSKKTAALQAELQQLSQKSKFAEARLANLDRVADAVGKNNMGFASAAGLERLQQQIKKTENELRTAQLVVDETGRKLRDLGVGPTVGRVLKSIGATAAQAARTGVQKLLHGLKAVGSAAAGTAASGARMLGSALKNLAGGAVRGIASLPGKLLRIGKAATSGSGGVKRLVQQIRNIGVVSLGMRIAGGMFGRLRSIVSNYISTNNELSAATSLLTKQMGQALEPAIRLVIAAMQQLMPVVQKVSAGVNAVLKAIIGEVGNVQYAFRQLGTYGFDQITKSDDEETGSATETAQSALVQKLVGWIDQLKAAFTAGDWRKLGKLVGDGINSVFDAINAVDVGKKIGTFTNNLFTTLHSVFTTVDFAGIGKTAAMLLNEAVERIDWNIVGETIGHALLAVPKILEGFVTGADWGQTSTALRKCLDGVFSVINRIDVIGKIGRFAGNLVSTLHGVFTGIDFAGIGRTTAQLLNEAIRQINWAKAGEIIGKALVAIPDILIGFVLETDWAKVGQSASECLHTALGTITDWLHNTDWLQIGKSAADLIANIDWGGIASDLFKGLGAALGASVSLLWGALGGVVTSIKDYFNEKIEEAGGSIAKGICNGIIEGFEKMINFLISGLNSIIEGFCSMTDATKALGIEIAIPKVSEIKLPRLARGTVVNGPTVAMIGEQGKEAVVPLENNTQWIDKVADKVNARVTGGGGNQPMIVQIFLGKRKLTEYLIQDINQITQETGVCPIKV